MIDLDVAGAARAAVQAAQVAGLIGLVAFAVLAADAVVSRGGRAIAGLAVRGVTGPGGRWSGLLRGISVVTAAAAALIVCFAFEAEIRTGPGRVIAELVPGQREDVLWVLSPGTDHFMNTSSISGQDAAEVQQRLAGRAQVLPFTLDLTEVSTPARTQTSLVIRLPAAAADDPGLLPGALAADPCPAGETPPAGEPPVCWPRPEQLVGDHGGPFPVGSRVEVGVESAVVAGTTRAPASMLNRAVWFGSYSTPPGQVYGLLVLPSGGQPVVGVAAVEAAAPGMQVLDTGDLLANNARFWTGNGTVLMLLLMVVIIIFSTMAQFGHRAVELQLSRTQLATLRAVGASRTQLLQTAAVRSVLSGLLATTIGLIAALGIVWLAGQAVVGFNAAVAPAMVLATAGILITADLAAVAFLQWRRRSTPLAQTLRP